ncbi:anthocyanidin 3-O-glucosyltransferase 6-like [Populus alba]|nr:anthocyanidin 3-O-glucosyltransferase 6-like [Populus alba]
MQSSNPDVSHSHKKSSIVCKLIEASCKMKNAELVFIPAPIIGHFASAVEVAKLLLERDKRLSITFLVMKSSLSTKIARSYNDSVIAACGRIRFIHLPEVELDPNLPSRFFISLIEAQKAHVKEEVSKLVMESESSPDSPRLAGFVLDMFSASIIDVANEFGVPSYIFFTSAAAFLGTTLYIQALHDEQKVDPTEFKNSDVELVMPCLASPFPAKVLPSSLLGKDLLPLFLPLIRRFREAKGIMVNTFYELESHAINSFSDGNYPPVYPVGPLLNLNGHEHDVVSDRKDTHRDIMRWLDHQPSSSVVYLCFGSMGSFGVEQVKEIACGLEQSGHRFLWSLRQPPPNGKMEAPSDYVNPAEVLPEGFLDRTSEIGKIIGWAPQVDILGHPSIGGFVSHCGWNSTLESIWFDVPMATWPMHAEQQLNAFLMIVEFGLAIEIQMNYRKEFNMDGGEIIRAEEIEKGVRCLMEIDIKKKEKLKEISEKSRKALMKDGSSSTWLDRVIQDMIDNMP